MTSHDKETSMGNIDYANAIEAAAQEGRLKFNENGKVEPSPEDFALVETDHSNAPAAEKYRLAQAAALLRVVESQS